MTSQSTQTCPSCGAAGAGNFCSACGASLTPRACAGCRAELSSHARFCHRCGQAVGGTTTRRAIPGSERKAWIAAGSLCVLLVAGIVYKVSSSTLRPAAPDMANAGSASAREPNENASGSTQPVAGPAPDISTMTPRERFDRLFNRIMQAAGRGDSAQVDRFTPMALGAYDQLGAPDIDARYHAAVLHIQVGDFSEALALADTILTLSPGHLFGYVIRGTAAGIQKNPAARAHAERDFLSHYQAEMAARRAEYLDHRPVLDQFKSEAEKSGKNGR
jgi:hypothetical protein